MKLSTIIIIIFIFSSVKAQEVEWYLKHENIKIPQYEVAVVSDSEAYWNVYSPSVVGDAWLFADNRIGIDSFKVYILLENRSR